MNWKLVFAVAAIVVGAFVLADVTVLDLSTGQEAGLGVILAGVAILV